MSRPLPLPTPVCFPVIAGHSSRARALVRAATLIAILPALVLFSSLLVQARPKNAQVMVSLEGTVTDHLNSHPVEDAHVELRDTSTKRVIADTQTGADGKFLLVNLALAPGRYSVRVSLAAYQREEQNLKIKPTTEQVPPILFALHCNRVPGPKTRYTVVKVFYATDRQEGPATVKWVKRLSYGNVRSRDGKLSLGVCEVSVPERHQLTGIEKPSFWRLEFREDPDKHVVVQSVQPETQDVFFKQVSDRVSASPEKDVFVFIHGYGVSFEAATQRTAQLSYDLGFHGAPILYSWPSKASWSGYREDEEQVKLTVDNLKNFLRELAQQSSARTIHLVAHSMGNRALLPALQQLRSDGSFQKMPLFRHIVLAAPDVDRDVFIQLAQQIKLPDNRVTLYVSSTDQVLLVSRKLFHAEARAGEGGPDIIVLPGVDTIDVGGTSTDLLGHSYYGNNRRVIADLLHIFMNQGVPRSGLFQVSRGSLVYWLLRPSN